MKKVCFVTPGTFAIPSERNSSVETVVMNIGERTKDRIHLAVTAKKSGDQPSYETKDGIVYIRPQASASQEYIRGVAQWLKHWQPDLVQVENRPRFVLTLKRWGVSAPIWLSLHSTTFISPPSISLRRLRTSLALADRTIANSRFLKDWIVRRIPQSAPHIVVNHLGVDPQLFLSRWSDEGEALRKQKLKELGYENRQIIVYAGRLIPAKGVHHLLRAFAAICRQHPDTILVLIGSATYGSDRITPYVAELHRIGNTMPKNVLFVPFQRHERMGEWFRIADIAVVPSGNQEAFGLVIVEAMASGACVVASRAGGMKEIIEHGENGILLSPENLEQELAATLSDLLRQPGTIRRLGQNGAAFVRERFTWEHTAERWLALFDRHIVKKKGRS